MKDMDDIPTALRAMEGYVPPQLSQLAADEIESLRELLASYEMAEEGDSANAIDSIELIVRLRAEVKRLRAVLLDPPSAVLALVNDMAGNELCDGADGAILRRVLRRCAEAAGLTDEQTGGQK